MNEKFNKLHEFILNCKMIVDDLIQLLLSIGTLIGVLMMIKK